MEDLAEAGMIVKLCMCQSGAYFLCAHFSLIESLTPAISDNRVTKARARICKLKGAGELIIRNRFLGSLNVYKFGLSPLCSFNTP